MPSEHNGQPPQDHVQAQVKHCSQCCRPLITEPGNAVFFDPNDATNVCTLCRDQVPSERMSLGDTHSLCDENESQIVRIVPRIAPAYDLAVLSHNGTHIQDERPLGNDIVMAETSTIIGTQSAISPEPVTPFRHSPTPPARQPATLRIVCDNVSSTRAAEPQVRALGTSGHSQPCTSPPSSPDPLVDITRIRVRSRGHHCLYPGASFQGTQKSGRNSYDVNVTIVVRHPFFPTENSMFLKPCLGRRFRIIVPLRLSPHTGSDRRLARAHHIF
jgi:hypothetical protein